MKKYLCIIEIKPEHAKEYVDIHRNPWREMLEAIKQSGHTKFAAFLHDGICLKLYDVPFPYSSGGTPTSLLNT